MPREIVASKGSHNYVLSQSNIILGHNAKTDFLKTLERREIWRLVIVDEYNKPVILKNKKFSLILLVGLLVSSICIPVVALISDVLVTVKPGRICKTIVIISLWVLLVDGTVCDDLFKQGKETRKKGRRCHFVSRLNIRNRTQLFHNIRENSDVG